MLTEVTYFFYQLILLYIILEHGLCECICSECCLLMENGKWEITALFNPLTTNVPCHIETSKLICNASQLTGFYIIGNIGR